MKRIMFLVPLLLCACKGGMKNDSEWSLGFETKLVLRQIGPKDTDAESLVYVDFADWAKQPLIDWIIKNEQSPSEEVIGELTNE